MPEPVRALGHRRHWVRVTTACNNRCIFCLDADTPRGLLLPEQDVKQDIDRGRDEFAADRLVLSGGEPSLHPQFIEFVRYARRRGYERVQIITNGHRFADRGFFEACMQAGLGEITFSLHGHEAELHDRLTRTPGAFKRLMKGLVRAVRDGRAIVNVDIVVNRQNVAVVPQIVELCLSLGVSEFDLLHLIPQGRAFEHRDELFYDVREYLPTLQQVFRLGQHPQVVVWTNRFPAAYLEGLEELIQDPHKLLDEVQGRRYQLRRYLDTGEPLDCRQVERCRHCYVEPFCTTMDRVVARQNHHRWQVWWIAGDDWDGGPLPFGCSHLGVQWPSLEAARDLALPPGVGLYALVEQADRLDEALGSDHPLIVVARTPQQLDAWLGRRLPEAVELEIELNRRTAPWLSSHRAELTAELDAVVIHQPSHEHLAMAVKDDVPEPAAFFRQLDLPVRVSGLPPCLAPGAQPVRERRILRRELFEPITGRLDIRELARHHLRSEARFQSTRCADCRVADRCDGAHINMIRHRGFRLLQPLTAGREAEIAERELAELWPEPRQRLATGLSPEPPAPSLPGFPEPRAPPSDPLAVLARQRNAARDAED